MTALMQHIGWVGFGTMAKAIFKGIADAGALPNATHKIVTHHTSSAQQASAEFNVTASNTAEIFTSCDVVFVCVKPHQLEAALNGISITENAPLLISILAGVSVPSIKQVVGAHVPVIRTMPNTPASIQKGVTALSASADVSDAQKTFATTCFDAVGETFWVDETQLDVVTAIAGSGPAFLYQTIGNWASFGVKNGLSAEAAKAMAALTMQGASEMVLNAKESTIDDLVSAVRSPNGTTEAGLNEWDSQHQDDHWHAILNASLKRAKQLGGSTS